MWDTASAAFATAATRVKQGVAAGFIDPSTGASACQQLAANIGRCFVKVRPRGVAPLRCGPCSGFHMLVFTLCTSCVGPNERQAVQPRKALEAMQDAADSPGVILTRAMVRPVRCSCVHVWGS